MKLSNFVHIALVSYFISESLAYYQPDTDYHYEKPYDNYSQEYGPLQECYGDLSYLIQRADYLKGISNVILDKQYITPDDTALILPIVNNLRYQIESSQDKCCALVALPSVSRADTSQLRPFADDLLIKSQEIIQQLGADTRFMTQCSKGSYIARSLYAFQKDAAAIRFQCLK